MGVKVTNRIYRELFRPETTNWLLGNVGDWQTLTIECEASVDFFATTGESVAVDTLNKTFTLNNGREWSEYGFDIGTSFVFYATYHSTDSEGEETETPTSQTLTIVNVYGSSIEVAEAIVLFMDEFSTFPANFGNRWVDNVRFIADVEPEGLRVVYGHVTNAESDSLNLNSFIDGTQAMFIQPSVVGQTVGTLYGMQAAGLQSGMSVREVYSQRLGKKAGTDNVYRYAIFIQYLISSFFETQDNILNEEKPEYLVGDGSLTDNFKLLFYPKWNNPNTLIQNDLGDTQRLGNTGWFDENFNQLVNTFAVGGVNYYDENGNPIDGINYAGETKVVAFLHNIPNINTDTICGFGFIYIPKYEEDYKNKANPFYQNTFVNTGKTGTATAPSDGFHVNTFYPDTMAGGGLGLAWMDVRAVKFTGVDGTGLITFEAFFKPTPEFTALFEDKEDGDRLYALWFSVADQAKPRNFSDRVSLLGDKRQMIKAIPPAGVFPYIQNVFIEHPFGENNTGVEEYDGFIHDDILCRLPFQVNPLTTQMQRITFGIEMFNPNTLQRFTLESYPVDLTQYFADINGVPQFNLNTTRGFKLANDNNKNWVKINRQPSLDASGRYGYLAYYAFKIRWEDWIAKTGVPVDFFDPDAENQGFNNDWYHYFSTMGWEINLFTDIDAVVDTQLVRYHNRWPFLVATNDKNQRIGTEHKYYRDSDDSLLNIGTDPVSNRPLGVILNNEPTRLEITYTILDDGVWDPAKVYATATIEVDKGAGFMQMRQISSVWPSEADNPLKPITGETRLKIEVDGTNKILKTSCLIDPELLTVASRYRITGRVGCYDDTGEVAYGLYESRYEARYE